MPDKNRKPSKDCDSFYVCWNQGSWGDKFWCAPGLVFNIRTMDCDWAWNLPEDSECYVPNNK